MSTREQQKSKYWPTPKAYALDLPGEEVYEVSPGAFMTVTEDLPADGKPWPTHCWCDAPVQPSESLDHRCRQCAQHCGIAMYRAGQP